MAEVWPEDEVLSMLVRESGEHKRAWALIAGLSKTILKERQAPERVSRKLTGPRPETWEDRIQTLEQRIVKQKRALAVLEECRLFELESEQFLVDALTRIVQRIPLVSDVSGSPDAVFAHSAQQRSLLDFAQVVHDIARSALATHATRQGPRSENRDG